MARWITITKAPFDYRWPDRSALTAFTETGEFFVKAEIADFAIARGYATEGKAAGSETKATKGGRSAKVATDAAAPDTGPDDRVDDAGVAAADRADVRNPVDHDPGQR